MHLNRSAPTLGSTHLRRWVLSYLLLAVGAFPGSAQVVLDEDVTYPLPAGFEVLGADVGASGGILLWGRGAHRIVSISGAHLEAVATADEERILGARIAPTGEVETLTTGGFSRSRPGSSQVAWRPIALAADAKESASASFDGERWYILEALGSRKARLSTATWDDPELSFAMPIEFPSGSRREPDASDGPHDEGPWAGLLRISDAWRGEVVLSQLGRPNGIALSKPERAEVVFGEPRLPAGQPPVGTVWASVSGAVIGDVVLQVASDLLSDRRVVLVYDRALGAPVRERVFDFPLTIIGATSTAPRRLIAIRTLNSPQLVIYRVTN